MNLVAPGKGQEGKKLIGVVEMFFILIVVIIYMSKLTKLYILNICINYISSTQIIFKEPSIIDSKNILELSLERQGTYSGKPKLVLYQMPDQ